MIDFRWLIALFKTNRQLLALVSVLTLHSFLLARIAVVNAPMYDEMAHVTAGLSHWQLRNFDLYRVNPPLMRLIATTPLQVLNPKTDWRPNTDRPYSRPEFKIGRRFLTMNGGDSFWYFTLCRWAQIPVSVFGGWICFRWARELFGVPSGFVALLLWCFCPNLLAWGATITPDAGAAAFGTNAAYMFWKWLKQPNLKTTMLSGLALGLAELSKSTWIVLFALWPLIWMAWRYVLRPAPASKPPMIQLAGLCLIGLYLLNLGYGFEGSFQKLGQFRFISHALGGEEAHESPGNRFAGTWLDALPVPVPANYIKGIDSQKYDFEKGKWAYLRGEQKLGGWWYYYLYAFAVKTPLGTLFLLGLAGYLAIAKREFAISFRDGLVLVAPAIVVFVLVSSQTGLNKYFRYVLPAIPFLYIFASRAGKAFELKQVWPAALCGIAVVSSIFGSLSVFPHSMSYFNLAAGGPLGGPAHLLDANIDWGQDLLELKRFVDRHPEVSPIHLAYFGSADPHVAGFPFEAIPRLEGDVQSLKLTPGWYAISVNHLFGYHHEEAPRRELACFRRIKPDAMAGYSIYIYHVTEDTLMKLNADPP